MIEDASMDPVSRNGAEGSTGPGTPGREHPDPDLAPADWTTADEIRRRSFGVVDRGFDPTEVREYLTKIADWFGDLHVQLSRLRKSQSHDYSVPAPQAVAPPQEEASVLAARMADLLRDAEEHATKVRAEADERVQEMEERARTMVGEAEERATSAVAEAEARAERVRTESGGIVSRARAEADERMAAAEAARASMLEELGRLQAQLAESVERLESAGEPPAPVVTLVPDRTDPAEASAGEASPAEAVPPTAQGLSQ